MSTLAEIETAIQQLPPEQWQRIRCWMDQHKPQLAKRILPAPPDVPKEELHRIHALIEAEFSKVD